MTVASSHLAGSIAPIVSAALSGFESWIVPPASLTSACANQAPAARGSTGAP
jgi:hypothetical protein